MAQFKNAKKSTKARRFLGLLCGYMLKVWFLLDLIRLWIGSRMHRQPLKPHIYWQRQQRGVPGDGSEGTALLLVYQPSAPLVGPKAKGDTFFKTSPYFSRVKHLLHPDLEKAALQQQLIMFHKHDLCFPQPAKHCEILPDERCYRNTNLSYIYYSGNEHF